MNLNERLNLPNICTPDHDKSIVNISASILNHYGIDIGKKTLPELNALLINNYKLLS